MVPESAGGNIPQDVAKIEIEEGGVWAEGRIPRKILKQIAEEAYKENPKSSLTDEDGNTWRMTDRFPTMVAYQSPAYRFKYVVGIRGTKLTSWTDIKADVAHLFGKVRESDRYEKDREYMLSMIRRHGKHNRWILVGHSLAGAIIKRLAADFQVKNYIDYTLSYNPSFELSDTKNNKPDERIHEVYTENDPLLKIREVIQPNIEANPNIEVKKEEDKGLLESHSIENPTLEGGQFHIPQEIKDMPKFKKMKHGIYKNLQMIREMKKNKKYDEYFNKVKAEGKMMRSGTTSPPTKATSSLKRWMREDWVDVKEALKGNYRRCGRKSAKDKPYPVCRPLKKVSVDTPITLPTLIEKGAVNKLKKAIKEKEKNPAFRIQFARMTGL